MHSEEEQVQKSTKTVYVCKYTVNSLFKKAPQDIFESGHYDERCKTYNFQQMYTTGEKTYMSWHPF